MSVILIALAGVVLVLLLVLVFRLHPLISLLLGSLFLLAATPTDLLLKSRLQGTRLSVEGLTSTGLIGLSQPVQEGNFLLWLNRKALADSPIVSLTRATGEQLQRASELGELTPLKLVWYQPSASETPIQVGTDLISEVKYVDLQKDRWSGLGSRLVEGFSKTFRKLGLPVTMAAVVGICLLQSGAALRLVTAIMAMFGTRGTAPALTASGFLLGVPVFFDTVFYLLLPLAKAVGRLHPAKFMTAVMAIIVGATMAHSLVPPTPGPLFVVGQVNEYLPADNQVSVGLMMIGGLIVGGVAAMVGFGYGTLCSRWIHLDIQALDADAGTEMDSDSQSPKKVSLMLAVLPIAIPIVLLGGSEIIEFMALQTDEDSRLRLVHKWTSIVNDPTLVFIGAALAAILLLRWYSGPETVAKSVAKGLSDAGVIVLLTCAGGAFGAALQQLDLAHEIPAALAQTGLAAKTEGSAEAITPWGMILTAFFLTTIIRFAQGSATVAMLTSSQILAPALATVELPFHPLYIALAIGCGSKPLPWMNDSGFWQVNTMTGMKPIQTLQSFSVALTIMGVVGFGITLIGARFLPLV